MITKAKIAAFLLLSGSYTLALGWNCLPNIGNLIPQINPLGLLGGGGG